MNNLMTGGVQADKFVVFGLEDRGFQILPTAVSYPTWKHFIGLNLLREKWCKLFHF